MSAPNKKREHGIFQESVLIRYLMKFSGFVYRSFLSGIFGLFMTSYNALERSFLSSWFGQKFKALSKNKIFGFARKTKRYAALTYEKSFFLNQIRSISAQLLAARINAFGFFFFFYGFALLLIQGIRYSFPELDLSMSEIDVGAVCMIGGFFMLFSKRSLASVIYDSDLLRWILFDCLGFRSIGVAEAAKKEAKSGLTVSLAFVMLFGFLSIFVEPLLIFFVIISFALLSMIFSSPESGVILAFFLLPFLQTKYLCVLVCLILLSYVLKLICGRRAFHFHLIDFAVLTFLLFLLFGGLVTLDGSSFLKMALWLVFMGMYFVIKNIISSPAAVKRCLVALVGSSTVVSVYGIYQNYFGELSAKWQDIGMFPEIRGRVVSLFDNPNVLGEFLILIFPITLALMATAKNSYERFFLFMSSLLNCLCLVFTWSRGAWIGCIVATLLFLCVSSRYFFAAGLLSLPVFGSLAFLKHESAILTRLTTFADSSTSYRVGIWRGVLHMLEDIGMYGVGIGEGAFAKIYPFYALAGIEAAPHAHSLYLQITVELGIFGLIAFLIFVFLYAQFSFSFCKSAMSRSNKLYCLGIFSGILAVLIQGLTDYVWYNYRIFLLFWMVAGLGMAHVYAAKNTEEEMDTIYF